MLISAIEVRSKDMVTIDKMIRAGLTAAGIVVGTFAPAISATEATSDSTRTVDFNERTHLTFMCEEEKLARDVYITLGMKYPASKVFGNIDDSEERHKCAVSDMLAKYEIPIPAPTITWGCSLARTMVGISRRNTLRW